MASAQSQPGYRQVRRIIRQQAKAVLVANDMRPSTKRGNREFNVALNRLAMQPYDSLDAAAQVGQDLGQKIVDLSKAKDNSHLDAGIIRQMVLTGEIPTITQNSQKPAKAAPVTIVAPKAKAETTTPAPGEAESTATGTAPADAPTVDEAPEPAVANTLELPAETSTASTPPMDEEAKAIGEIPAKTTSNDTADGAPEVTKAEADEETTVPDASAEKDAELTGVAEKGEPEAVEAGTETEALTDDAETEPKPATPV